MIQFLVHQAWRLSPRFLSPLVSTWITTFGKGHSRVHPQLNWWGKAGPRPYKDRLPPNALRGDSEVSVKSQTMRIVPKPIDVGEPAPGTQSHFIGARTIVITYEKNLYKGPWRSPETWKGSNRRGWLLVISLTARPGSTRSPARPTIGDSRYNLYASTDRVILPQVFLIVFTLLPWYLIDENRLPVCCKPERQQSQRHSNTATNRTSSDRFLSLFCPLIVLCKRAYSSWSCHDWTQSPSERYCRMRFHWSTTCRHVCGLHY